MRAHRRRSTDVLRTYRKRGLQVYLGLLLGLCALVAQLLLPVTHAWHEEFGYEAHVGSAHPVVLPLANRNATAEWSGASALPQEPSHDPIHCPICQAFSHLRDGILTPVRALGLPVCGSGLSSLLSYHVNSKRFLISAPRAPPFAS